MADVGRFRTVATLTAVLIAACASTAAHPSPLPIRSPTVTASAHPLAARAPVASKALLETIYLTFDVDANQSGQQAAELLAHRLDTQGIAARRVMLPQGHDPNSFFVQGGDARQFQSLLEAALL